jgi:hypothetical protein
MNRFFASALLLGVIGSEAVATLAEAACNAIPSVDQISASQPSLLPPPLAPASSTTLNTAITNFGYKGALGRVDRVHLLPTAASKEPSSPDAPAMVVVADGVCIDPDGRPVDAGPATLSPVDDLVVLVYAQRADAKRTILRAYGTPETCNALAAAAKVAALDVATTCSLDGVRPIPIGGSLGGLRIPLPNPRELDAAGAVPTLRVIVAPKAIVGSTEPQSTLLANAATQSCSQMCPQLAKDHAATCIDNIYALSTSSSGQAQYSPDPVPCNVQMPTTLQVNDFSKACEDLDSTTVPTCQASTPLPALILWQDTCGGVHIPFDWTAIRTLPNGTKETRWLFGQSGVGRKKSDQDPSFWVPGREFVGSTPVQDPQGTTPGVSWRKPLIDIWKTNNDDEFGFQGTADQDNSIVHVFPRLHTQLVCTGTSGNNACMGIEQHTTGGDVICACEDRGVPGCGCELLQTARYFVCSSGPNKGMPCTRDRHCNPNGTCDGKPHCQDPADSVWTGQPDSTGTECTVDDDCKNQGTKTQCGYRLFSLADAINNPGSLAPVPTTGTIVLDPTLTMGGPHKRRGVCKANPAKSCGNGTGPGACSQGDCRGYQLQAGRVQ